MFGDEAGAAIRLRPVSHDVAEAPDLVGLLCDHFRKDRLESVIVRVDV